jgi:hypothetical protein
MGIRSINISFQIHINIKATITHNQDYDNIIKLLNN